LACTQINAGSRRESLQEFATANDSKNISIPCKNSESTIAITMNDKSGSTFFNLTGLRVYPGALHSLKQPSLIGMIRFSAELPDSPDKFDKPLAALVGKCFTSDRILPENLVGGRLKPPASRRLQLAQNIADVAIALQISASHPASRGLVLRTAKAETLYVVIPYYLAESGEAALKTAIKIVQAAAQHICERKLPDQQMLETLVPLVNSFRSQHSRLAPPSGSLQFVRIAERRNIPWNLLAGGIIQLGYGVHSRRFFGTFTDRTNNISARIARNKTLASSLLRKSGVPVPEYLLVRDAEGAINAAKRLGFPVVLKPAGEDGGLGVHSGLNDEKAVRRAFEQTAKLVNEIIVERHIAGDDYRLLVINGKFVSAVRRIPGGITGDGRHSVRELIDLVNQDPRRGDTKDKLVKLSLDEEAKELVTEAGLTPESVLEKDRFLVLRRRANVNTGGMPVSVASVIHRDNCLLAERAARIVGLDIAGVDYLTTDITRSWRETGGAICEVNGQPGLRLHWFADAGAKVNERIVNHLFPASRNGRIPIVALAGSRDSAAICSMLHAILLESGLVAGLATSRGAWIGNNRVSQDSTSAFDLGRGLLLDPVVQAAVYEIPMQTLTGFGVPFDLCMTAGITGIMDADIKKYGAGKPDTVMQIQSSLLARARDALVINADDSRLLSAAMPAMARNRILVSAGGDNRVVNEHVQAGGVALMLRQLHGKKEICRVTKAGHEAIADISELFAGHDNAQTLCFNALFASALAIGSRVPVKVIQSGLKTCSRVLGKRLVPA
jgi:cyanophycin synthetase